MNFHQFIEFIEFIFNSDWEKARTIAQTFQSTVLSIVPLAVGFWFLKRRKFFPKATLSYKVIHNKFLEENTLLVRVVVEITNKGDVTIKLTNAEIWLQWIFPLVPDVREQIDDMINGNKKDVDWSIISSKKVPLDTIIESDESDCEYFDLIIKGEYSKVKTMLVTTMLQSVEFEKQDRTWSLSTLHEVDANIGDENE